MLVKIWRGTLEHFQRECELEQLSGLQYGSFSKKLKMSFASTSPFLGMLPNAAEVQFTKETRIIPCVLQLY